MLDLGKRQNVRIILISVHVPDINNKRLIVDTLITQDNLAKK